MTKTETLQTEAIKKFLEGWSDFCKHINWKGSNLSAENIGWMNDVEILMRKANAKK